MKANRQHQHSLPTPISPTSTATSLQGRNCRYHFTHTLRDNEVARVIMTPEW